MAIIAMIGAIHAISGALKWFAVRQNRDVLLFAAARSAGERLSTQLNTKNMTVSTIMMCARARCWSTSQRHCRTFTLRYREGRDDWRVVEREHHHRDRQPQGQQQTVAGRGCAAQRQGFQRSAVPLWIRYRASTIRAATNGNTSTLIAFTIICSPKRTMVIIPTIRIRDRIARGGGSSEAGAS